MNELNLSEIRNSKSEFDENGAFLFAKSKVSGIRYGNKVYTPTSAININKNLDVNIDSSYLYVNPMTIGNFLEVESSPYIRFRLKHQHELIERVKSFKNFHDLNIGHRYFIKQTGENSIIAIQIYDESLRAAGPKNTRKLNLLFNTAMHNEEYELASVVNKAIRNMLSSRYTAPPARTNNYVALLTE